MDNQNLDHLRHSAAHLLAAAVTELWPEAKLTLGPPIEDGFYYDIDFGDVKISEADLPAIETKMHQIAPGWKGFASQELSPSEARKKFAGNPYKLELVEEIISKKEPITLYTSGNFSDLCRGGHIDLAQEPLNHFKLLSVAGAYWRGSEKNPMLTRIYGTVWPTEKELADYLARQEEAKTRDHRLIGKNLNLFVFSDVIGKGLPLLTPKGATIRRELERYVVDEELKHGYQPVVTPHLAKTDLYKTSGHFPYYKDTMYPVMKVDEEELILRPMTCPHHFMIFKSQTRSYKELPIKYAELASQFRYEKSGELTGLMRVRTFTLTDAHIFCSPEQAKSVISDVLDLIQDTNSVLGLKKGEDYRYRLSLGDRGDSKKYYKDDVSWEFAENVLRKILTDRHEPFFEAQNEAAFYGPKIDVQVKKVNGHEETAFTVQYDFVMPSRFELHYTGEDGQLHRPIVIHHSVIGAFERTMAFLIEKFGGAFPAWLSPVQVIVLPITEKHSEYAADVLSQLKSAGIRAELDDRNQPLSARIRDAEMQKIPYILAVGDKEIAGNSVSVRERGRKAQSVKPVSEFIAEVKHVIINRS